MELLFLQSFTLTCGREERFSMAACLPHQPISCTTISSVHWFSFLLSPDFTEKCPVSSSARLSVFATQSTPNGSFMFFGCLSSCAGSPPNDPPLLAEFAHFAAGKEQHNVQALPQQLAPVRILNGNRVALGSGWMISND